MPQPYSISLSEIVLQEAGPPPLSPSSMLSCMDIVTLHCVTHTSQSIIAAIRTEPIQMTQHMMITGMEIILGQLTRTEESLEAPSLP